MPAVNAATGTRICVRRLRRIPTDPTPPRYHGSSGLLRRGNFLACRDREFRDTLETLEKPSGYAIPVSLAGNLRDLSLADLLDGAKRDRRSGVLRLRQNGPDGAQRGDLVLREGEIVGAALYRAGGVEGMGDALVEAALCSPEDAMAAMQHAAGTLAQPRGALAAGAERVGVPIAYVVDTLRAHVVAVASAMREWRSGTYELVAEGFPAGGADRDSAAARAFLLDEGLTGPPVFGEADPSRVTAVSFAAPPEDRVAVPALNPVAAASADTAPGDDWFEDAVAPASEAAAETADETADETAAATETADMAPAPDGDDSDAADLENDDGPDEGMSAGVDLSAPGFGETALMEAETLLDSEVLAVMLEMGNSAAATAAVALEAEAGAVRTGHLVLVDEDGQLAMLLVPPLREAGYIVHIARGAGAALEKLAVAAADRERPLVVCDLLLKRDAGGMLGGLDVAAQAALLDPAPPVLLLAETSSDDVRANAETAGVRALVPRPMKSELKKDEAKRAAFLVELLQLVHEHRPHPEWRVDGGGQPWETTDVPVHHGDGWNVAEIESRAAAAEEIPEFAAADPAARREALWRETMRELSAPLSPQEILLNILRFGAEVLTRGVLFTPAGKVELKGYGQFGIELAPDVDPDEAVRQIRFPHGEHPGIARTLEERVAIRWTPTETPWESHLVRGLGGRAPAEVFLGPIFCQGRLAGLLYGDMLPLHDAVPETTNLEVVLGQAGLALDRHVLETRLAVFEGTNPTGRRNGENE